MRDGGDCRSSERPPHCPRGFLLPAQAGDVRHAVPDYAMLAQVRQGMHLGKAELGNSSSHSSP